MTYNNFSKNCPIQCFCNRLIIYWFQNICGVKLLTLIFTENSTIHFPFVFVFIFLCVSLQTVDINIQREFDHPSPLCTDHQPLESCIARLQITTQQPLAAQNHFSNFFRTSSSRKISSLHLLEFTKIIQSNLMKNTQT